MAFLSSLADWGNKAVDWYKDNPIISDVAVPGLATLYNQYQQNSANKTATGQMTAGIEQGLASLNQFYGTARQDAVPYMASGLQGLSQYQGLLANPNAVKESEDYKFRFAEGQQALERSAAAKGMLMSGNTLQELQQYGQGFASRELDAALQRRIPLMETGLTSQRSLAELGQGYANAIAELYGQHGDVAALGTRTEANTTTGTLRDTLGILSDLNKARTAVDGPVLNAAKSIGNYLGGNAAANAGALNGLGAVGGTVAGLGSIGGAGIGIGASALGGGGFGAGLGASGLGGAGIGGAGAGTLPGMGGTTAAFNSMSSGIGAQALGASGATPGFASSLAAAAPYLAAGAAALFVATKVFGGKEKSALGVSTGDPKLYTTSGPLPHATGAFGPVGMSAKYSKKMQQADVAPAIKALADFDNQIAAALTPQEIVAVTNNLRGQDVPISLRTQDDGPVAEQMMRAHLKVVIDTIGRDRANQLGLTNIQWTQANKFRG